MADTLTIEGLNDLFAKQKTDVVAQVNAILAESQKKAAEPETKAVVTLKDSTPEAKLEERGIAGTLSGITSFKIFDIPLGSALVGGAIGILATELVDGFMTTQTKTVKGIVKLVIAGVYAKWGFGGGDMKKVVALLIAFDALRDLTPIDTWMNRLANWITSRVPTGGLGAQVGGRTVLSRPLDLVVDNYSSITRRTG